VNKKIKNIKIAYGGMASTPKRAMHCEKILLNTDFSKDIILKAQKSLEKDFAPIDDMRASKNYRMEIAKNLLVKCFLEIKNDKLVRLNY
jgi:xanthine dehydrogenase small subunit